MLCEKKNGMLALHDLPSGLLPPESESVSGFLSFSEGWKPPESESADMSNQHWDNVRQTINQSINMGHWNQSKSCWWVIQSIMSCL